jgi:drug/metabolite transporter (DMT)-like permease
LIYVLLLIVVTAIWGWTFVLVKDAVTQYPTLPFLQIRFALAALVMAVVVHRLPTRREWKLGLIVGAALAGGYLTQTVGLAITSPGNAGLITGMVVVFTPLIGRIFGAPIRWWTWLATAVSLAGIVLLAGGLSGLNVGDVLVLVCAVLFALQLVLLGRWSPGLRAAPLAMVQMIACAVLFSAGGSWSLRPPSTSVWIALAITGVFASALAFYVQTLAQKHIDPNRVALIFTLEPAWALVAAFVLAGQRFGLEQALGAALMLTAIVGHELASLKFKAHGHQASA